MSRLAQSRNALPFQPNQVSYSLLLPSLCSSGRSITTNNAVHPLCLDPISSHFLKDFLLCGLLYWGWNSCSVPDRRFVVVVQSLSCVWLIETPWTAAHKASLSITNFWSSWKLISIKLVMPSNHLILYCPLSFCLQSFPASGSFLVNQFFSSDGQSIGASASASVLPVNFQGWFPLGRLVWSPCYPRDSQESSPAPQFESINFLTLSLFYEPILTSVHDYWKKP